MNIQDLLSKPVLVAMNLISHNDDNIKVAEGYHQLKTLADAGDMSAAACLGYASQFEHFEFYNLEECRGYLQKAADANNILGQYYLGSMLFFGEKPFKEDKVYGKWLIDQARNAGLEEANRFWDNLHKELSPEDARQMMLKAKLGIIWEALKKPFTRKG